MFKFFFIFLFLFSSLVFGVQEALIGSSKAIIYADEDLAIPLGYVTRGKKIVIGSQALKKGYLYSIVLNGKIAFIQAKDVNILTGNEKDKKVTEHNIEILEKPESEIFSLNNFLSLSLATMDMGQQWKDLAQAIDPENTNNNLSYYRLLFEHHDKRFLLNYSMGLDFMGKEQSQLKFSAWGFEGNAHFSPIRTKIFTLDFLVGLAYYPSLSVDNPLSIEPKKSGSMYGLQYGALVRLFPYSKWGAFAGMMITNFSVSLDPIMTQQESYIITDPVYSQKVDKMGGSTIFLGLSYKI